MQREVLLSLRAERRMDKLHVPSLVKTMSLCERCARGEEDERAERWETTRRAWVAGERECREERTGVKKRRVGRARLLQLPAKQYSGGKSSSLVSI